MAGAVVVKEDGGGESERGAGRRFDGPATDEDEVGRVNSDSESEELARVGGEMVGLDGAQPLGERESELELEDEDDRLREKLVKANMLIIGLSVLDVLMKNSVLRELGLGRLLL